jgi:hypothetical protein
MIVGDFMYVAMKKDASFVYGMFVRG